MRTTFNSLTQNLPMNLAAAFSSRQSMHKTLVDDPDADTYNCGLLADREISFGIMVRHDGGMILSIVPSFTPLQSS